MCVIVYKPTGQTLDEKDIDLMWSKNNDGAGIAYFATVDNNPKLTVIIEKGFMKLSHLKKRLDELFKDYGDFSLAVHFRNATHGGVTEELTHPFAISKDEDAALGVFDNTFDAALMHNGVIHGFGSETKSDTLEFITTVLAFVEPEARPRFLEMIHGKFLLMQNETFYFCGEWEEHNGLKVSNTHWKPIQQYSLQCNPMYQGKKNKRTGFQKEEPEIITDDPYVVRDELERDWFTYCGHRNYFD